MAKRTRSASYDLAAPARPTQKAGNGSATATIPQPPAPAPALNSSEPDVVQAVRCILAGQQPPDWLWRFKPKPDDDFPALFLRPHGLVEGYTVPLGFSAGIPTLALEKVASLSEDQPLPDHRSAQIQARIYEQDMERMTKHLIELTKDYPNTGPKKLGPADPDNGRFTARVAAAAHQELAALLAGWERCQGERWRGPVVPPPAPPREEPSLFDRVDRLFLDLAGRLGLHPTELAELRFGRGNSTDIEARLRERLPREQGRTLAGQLENRGLVSPAERAWLDRGEMATRMEIASLALQPLEETTWVDEVAGKTCGPVSPVQFVGRHRSWEACPDELARKPILPEKLFELATSGDAASSSFDELDRRLVDMAGRMGVHPAELAVLRFGDTGSAIGSDLSERNLRANLAGDGTLGQLVQRHGILTDREAAWLDRRERPTVVRLRSSHGGSLTWPADAAGGDHVVSPLQYVGKGLGRHWEAAAEKVARIPAADALDFGP